MSMILSQILSLGQRDSHAFTKSQKKKRIKSWNV